MNELNKINLNLTDAEVRKIAVFFKEKKIDEKKQNEFFENLFIKQAKLQGFNEKQIEIIKKVTHSVEFDLSPSELLYSMHSTTFLQKKIDEAKHKIENEFDTEKQKNKKLSEKENDKKPKVVMQDKDDELDEKPFNFELKRKLLFRICLRPENAMQNEIYAEIRTQALAQGMTDQDLSKKVNHFKMGKGSNAKEQEINPPKTLVEVLTEIIKNDIVKIAQIAGDKDAIENIISEPANAKNPEMRLLVMCKLKEANDKEFNDLINNPAMQSFLGAHALKEIIKARKKDKELASVIGASKVKEPDEKDKPFFNPPSLFSEEDMNLMEMLGITEPISTEELHNLAADYGLIKTNKKD